MPQVTADAAQRAHAPRTRARARGAPFVAFDGEGAEIDGEHRYILMCASTGKYVQSVAGISTRDALSFIVREGQGKPKPISCAFAFNYDVNMLLRDLTREQLLQLWETGAVDYLPDDATGFAIEWVPSKFFGVYAEIGDVQRYTRVYDVFGFFQQSFVKALSSWGHADNEFVRAMKDRRGTFHPSELPEIRRYCFAECDLAVQLMGQVRDALHSVDLKPRSWLGAGAIASALMAKHDVHEHLGRGGAHRPALDDALMRAYFGGRTEVFQQGIFPRAVSWDINSAYPHAASQLPTGAGRWRRAREYEPDQPWALWRCSWSLPAGALIAPFPFRSKRAIYFPREGEGYYHAPEVAAALAVYPEHVHVTSGYVFEPASDVHPFDFIPGVYDQRAQLKADGDPAEKVLKLGINSVYGKLAQGNSRDGHRPKFQSYFWAGAITAATRARMLLAAALEPASVVAIATDGIVFSPDCTQLHATPGLGGWERTGYRNFFVAQPGMYHAIDRSTNSAVKHSRGFFTKEIDFGKLRKLWLERGPVATLPCRSTRFVGLGSALMRSDFTIWRCWVEADRRISLYLSPKKTYDDEEPAPAKRLHPPERIRAGLSDIYVPKRAVIELDPDAEEWVQGSEQPGRVF